MTGCWCGTTPHTGGCRGGVDCPTCGTLRHGRSEECPRLRGERVLEIMEAARDDGHPLAAALRIAIEIDEAVNDAATERCDYCGKRHEVEALTLASGIVVKSCPSVRSGGGLFDGAWALDMSEWERPRAFTDEQILRAARAAGYIKGDGEHG